MLSCCFLARRAWLYWGQCRSVHHFGPNWNNSTLGWVDNHGSKRKKCIWFWWSSDFSSSSDMNYHLWSTAIGWIAIKFSQDIYFPLRLNHNNSGEHLTFIPAMLLGQNIYWSNTLVHKHIFPLAAANIGMLTCYNKLVNTTNITLHLLNISIAGIVIVSIPCLWLHLAQWVFLYLSGISCLSTELTVWK